MTNVTAKADLYKRVRLFKSSAMIGALCLGLWESTNLRKKMNFYDRFYPEPTELQRKLSQEAAMFREQAYTEETIQERMDKAKDPRKALNYAQFYQLAPQNHIIAEEQFNAPDHQ